MNRYVVKVDSNAGGAQPFEDFAVRPADFAELQTNHVKMQAGVTICGLPWRDYRQPRQKLVVISQRTPRLMVRLGRAFQSSCRYSAKVRVRK